MKNEYEVKAYDSQTIILVLLVWSIIGVKAKVSVLYCRFLETLKGMTLLLLYLTGFNQI